MSDEAGGAPGRSRAGPRPLGGPADGLAGRGADVASPCISVCRMDPARGWCIGCLRTIDEIAAWSALADDTKRAVLARIAERRVVWFDRPATP